MSVTLKKLGLLAALGMIVSCANPSSKADRNVASPSAPKQQESPNWLKGFDQGQIDPLHMQTQADFHFAKGEALSLEGQNHLALREFRAALIFDNKSTSLRMRLAKEYVRLGHYGEALSETQVVVEQEPNNLDARLLLGGLYSTLKLYEPARLQYDTILKMDPKNQSALHYKGALLLDQGKFAEAKVYFENLAQGGVFENPHTAYFYLARIDQLDEGDAALRKSLVPLKKALATKGDFIEAALLLAKTYERLGQNELAVKTYRDYIATNGSNGQMLEEMGGILLKMGRTQEALNAFLELEQIEPKNQNASLRVAFILVEQGEYQGAVERLERVVAGTPDADKIRFYLGAVYEEIKDFAKAREHFSKIPPESSYYAESILHRSFLYKLEGNVPAALEVLKAAMPFVQEARIALLYASYLEEQKRIDEAISHLEKHLSTYPDVPDFFYFLGSLWEQKGDPTKSISYLEKVLTLEPKHVQALNHLAYSLAEQGKDLDRAERYARLANELQPSDGYIMDTLGWVLFKQGRYHDSIIYLEQAHQKASHEAIIAEHLGDAYFKTQLPEKAIEMYGKAYEAEQTVEGRQKIQQKMSQVENHLQAAAEERKPASQKP